MVAWLLGRLELSLLVVTGCLVTEKRNIGLFHSDRQNEVKSTGSPGKLNYRAHLKD